jgi:hypothetical protein
MNKLIWIPLATIIIMAVVSSAYDANDTFVGNYQPGGGESTIVVDGVETQVNITGTSQNIPFNLSGMDMAMIILIGALAVAGIAGIRFLGSGVSDLTQQLIFQSVIYLGIWGIFSVFAWDVIGNMGTTGTFIWLILTLMLVVGFASEVSGGASSGD